VTDPVADALGGVSVETEELRRANVALQRQLAREKARTEALVDAVERAAHLAATVAGRPKAAKAKPDRRRKDAEVALVHATDWQCGKRTSTYDSDVLAERIARLADKVVTLTEIQRADHPVNECVIMFGGDMVEGVSVFAGQAWEVDSTLFEQVFTTARIMEQLVVDLAANFSKVRVVCEYGNHGRLGRRGDHPAHDNVDLMVYRIVADRTAHLADWQLSTDWYQIVEVGNYRAMLAHGDEIKSFGGNTPAFGILRKANAWASGVVADFADIYMGHYHTPMTLTMANGGQVYVSGSPESDNQYAAEFVAARGHPSQRLHFIDPDAGRVAASYLVWLDR
jgi:hypothetical protein